MLAALERAAARRDLEQAVRRLLPWLDLPGTDTGELLARAEAAGVAFVAGRDFFPPGAGGAESVRLAYSAVGVTEIELGSSGCSRSSASRREPEPS